MTDVHDAGPATHDELARLRQRIADLEAENARYRQMIEGQAQLRRAFAYAPNAVIITDAKAQIQYVNDAFTAQTGYTSDEVIGQNLRLLQSGNVPRDYYETMWTTLSAGRVWRGEFHNRKKDGALYWGAAVIAPIHNEQGTITHYIGITEDITPMKQARAMIQQSKTNYHQIVALSPGAIMVHRGGKFLFVNAAAATLLGAAQPDQLVGSLVMDVIPPHAREIVGDRISRVVQGDDVAPHEQQLLRLDGILVDVSVLSAPIEFEGQAANLVIARDIAARKQAERELQERNQMLRRAQQIGDMGHWAWDLATNTVTMSDTAVEIFGYLPDREGMPLTIQEIMQQMSPDDLPRYMAVLAQARETGVSTPVEVRIALLDGTLKDVLIIGETVNNAHGQPISRIGIVQDITTRKQAERELQENQQRLDLALRSADHALWDWNLKTGEIIRNDFWATMLGYAPADLEDSVSAWERLIHPEDRLRVNAVLQAHLTGELSYYEAEYRLRTHDDRWVWVYDRGRVVEWDAAGDPCRIIGMHHDVTARKHAEQRRRRSEERHRAMLQAIPDLIIRMNRKGEYLEVIEGEGVTLARPCDELLGCLVTDVLPLQVAQQTLSRIRRTLDTGEMQQNEYSLEVEGKSQHFVARSVVYGPDEVLTIVHDVTDRKNAAQRMLELAVERERVQVLTNFISSASHEFRTPLSVIGLNTYLLEKVDDRDRHTHYLGEITGQINHLVKLVDGLLIMARLDSKVAPQRRPIDIKQSASWIVNNYQDIAADAEIDLVCTCTGDLPLLWCDPDLIRQAVGNILDNALRYTPAGGTVTVNTEQRATHVVISVADTGPGLTAVERACIFERFYRGDEARSTRGFGLGLPIAQSIVELHGGCIEVESQTGAGSTFRILLPLPEDDAP